MWDMLGLRMYGSNTIVARIFVGRRRETNVMGRALRKRHIMRIRRFKEGKRTACCVVNGNNVLKDPASKRVQEFRETFTEAEEEAIIPRKAGTLWR